jgi:sigma-E factor negative regulatory protein RseA
MNKDSLEHLSALMDGEMTRETGLFLARRLGSDAEYRDAWARYHLIRDCIQRPGSNPVASRFCEELTARLEGEGSARRRGAPRWLRPVSGAAIAASVALVAIMVTGPGPSTDVPAGAEAPARFTSPNVISAAPASEPVSYSSQRLNSYLLRHNQVAGAAARQGFVTYVPVLAAPSGAEADTAEPVDGAPATDAAATDAAEEARDATR